MERNRGISETNFAAPDQIAMINIIAEMMPYVERSTVVAFVIKQYENFKHIIHANERPPQKTPDIKPKEPEIIKGEWKVVKEEKRIDVWPW